MKLLLALSLLLSSCAAKDAGHKGEYAEYEWLERVARTSMIVELVQSLHRHGYQISKLSA